MVVDDDGINLFLAISMLVQLFPKSKLLEAINGLEAVEVFQKESPDIIFMDIQMPKMNGYDATIAIRKLTGGSLIPIIALTAGTVTEDIQNCFISGVGDFSTKPIVKTGFEKIFQKYFGYKFTDTLRPEHELQQSKIRKPIDLELLKLRLGMDDEIVTKIIFSAISSFLISISELKQSIFESDEAQIKAILHKMYGTALSICCDELARLTKEFESQSIFERRMEISLVSKMDAEIDYIKEFVKSV